MITLTMPAYSVYTVHSSGVVTAAAATGEQNLAAIPIPAGFLGTSGQIRLSFCFTNNSNSNTKTLIVRMNTTSAAVSGGYAIMAANQTTNQTYTGTLFINNTSATTQQITNALGTFAATANVPAAGSIDTTATSYININCNKVTATDDAVVLVAWTLEAFKGGVTYSG